MAASSAGRRAWGAFAAGLAATVAAAAVGLAAPQFLSFLDLKAYDSLLRATPHQAPTGRVVVADLDDAALSRYGQWPWPRYRTARLLSLIRKAGASAVAVDMVFAEEDRTSVGLLSREIRRDFGVAISTRDVPPEAYDGDRALASSLAGGPFVLGYAFDFATGAGDPATLHPLPIPVRSRGEAGTGAIGEARGVVGNLPGIARAAASSGFFNVVADRDGVLRRVPLVLRHRGVIYPALSLATVLLAPGAGATLDAGRDGIESLTIRGRRIPLDGNGDLAVNFRGGRRTFRHVSASDILDGKVPDGALDGKIVVLGTTAAGLQEIRTTPVEAAHPGPEIQATVIDNLLAGDALDLPRAIRPAALLLVLAAGALVAFASSRGRAVTAVGTAAVAGLLAWGGAWWLLARHGTFLSPVLPSATVALAFSVTVAFRFAHAEREVRLRERKLAMTQDAVIQSLASLAETRHQETGGHIQRTRHYMRALALALRKNPRHAAGLDDGTIDLLFRLAPLHDIGKVGVRDSILLKRDRLTEAEYEEMKRHTLYGSETIRVAKDFLGGDSFLAMADQIVRTHQERWDGTGYPDGLRGEEIPLAGRLMAVADVYDALISARGYKAAIPHDRAVEMMVAESGSHFDPDVIAALLEVKEEFRRIAARFEGGGVEPEPPALPGQ
jgi:adenylate cyclase